MRFLTYLGELEKGAGQSPALGQPRGRGGSDPEGQGRPSEPA